MPELLLELGCEELPAAFIEKAANDLRSKIFESLSATKLVKSDAKSVVMGTPRRLIVSFAEVESRQPDERKEIRGPALQAAFDEQGNPTRALEGFCKSNGVDASALRRDEKYVWADKEVAGKATVDLLSELLPQAIKSLSFDKTMRWGSARMRFARPIRWILAAFGGELVPFSVESVQSTLATQGHRFYSPDMFEARSLTALLDGLRNRFVEPDAEVRQDRIRRGAKDISTGEPVLTEALIDENTYLTEWPTAVEGQFNEEFLELPKPVLITAMAKHEKMFPVQTADGNLTNRFVFIRNSGEDETVRQGSEWVLNARFNDARFFFEEDRKRTLEQFLERTSTIVFQEKLGNVRQRADRLSKLAQRIAEVTGGSKEEQVLARTAGLYCKADLATGLVSELPSLQGIIGSEYAKREGMLDDVAWAIASHYDLGKNPNVNCDGAKTAVRVTMADQLDKLTGYLGLGLEPSGSSDPFGLRRAATMLIEAALMWGGAIPSFSQLLSEAAGFYREQEIALDEESAQAALSRLFESRYESMLTGVRHDILNAAILDAKPDETSMPRRIRLRIQCLESLSRDTLFVQTATRPINIVADARRKGIEFSEENPLQYVDADALQSETAFKLLQALKLRAGELEKAVQDERVEDVVSLTRALERPINDCFEGTMVMAPQEDIRYSRLSLMNGCAHILFNAGDFSKLTIPGNEDSK
ncbi:MAG TPA: glycine--tRNA ligase subunit beta [Fimbriimonadaceae bacterium]|nr:glycine--tRNA ligase subunit beta [Fimbriimonadaceae bacterium]